MDSFQIFNQRFLKLHFFCKLIAVENNVNDLKNHQFICIMTRIGAPVLDDKKFHKCFYSIHLIN